VIDRRVLPSGEVEEWERAATIPDDFIYDPEIDAYYPPGEPVTWDFEAQRREFEEARRRGDFGDGGLISRDELLGAQAVSPPPSQRKARPSRPPRNEQLDLFAGLEEDGDTDGAKSAQHGQDGEEADSGPSDAEPA
jgi:hypothetical protein